MSLLQYGEVSFRFLPGENQTARGQWPSSEAMRAGFERAARCPTLAMARAELCQAVVARLFAVERVFDRPDGRAHQLAAAAR